MRIESLNLPHRALLQPSSASHYRHCDAGHCDASPVPEPHTCLLPHPARQEACGIKKGLRHHCDVVTEPVRGMLLEHKQANACALPDQLATPCLEIVQVCLRMSSAHCKSQQLPDEQPVRSGQQHQSDQDHGSKACSAVRSSGPLTPWLPAPEEKVASLLH